MARTLGPMKVDHDGPSRPIICAADGRMLSVSAFEYGRWGSYDNEEDDAHLFAAASQLLQTLDRFRVAMRAEGKPCMLELINTLHDADAAIAKATGGH
jgi:hypothetical protein